MGEINAQSRRVLLSERALCFLLEVVLPIAVLNVGFITAQSLTAAPSLQAFLGLGLALLYAVWFVYFLIKDSIGGGRSFVKRWRGLRVVTLEGNPCLLWQSCVRNVVLIVPVIVWIEAIVVIWRKDSRRLGDWAAKTKVVPDLP